MVQVTKKKKETTVSLLKRFSRKMKQSGVISKFKNRQFKTRAKSALKKKEEALKRMARAKKMEKLFKLGKIKPTAYSHKS
ncbi:MAG: hypothetical protein PHC85_01620 [Candidatus Pacebacteria bacterium]|nr:hypothetical protein [Candidatus Paceibacterota bacterium]